MHLPAYDRITLDGFVLYMPQTLVFSSISDITLVATLIHCCSPDASIWCIPSMSLSLALLSGMLVPGPCLWHHAATLMPSCFCTHKYRVSIRSVVHALHAA